MDSLRRRLRRRLSDRNAQITSLQPSPSLIELATRTPPQSSPFTIQLAIRTPERPQRPRRSPSPEDSPELVYPKEGKKA